MDAPSMGRLGLSGRRAAGQAAGPNGSCASAGGAAFEARRLVGSPLSPPLKGDKFRACFGDRRALLGLALKSRTFLPQPQLSRCGMASPGHRSFSTIGDLSPLRPDLTDMEH